MKMNAEVNREHTHDVPPAWAWLAAGAVAAGAVGAIIGCARSCSRTGQARLMARPRPAVDTAHVTPPHGDALDLRE
jgi:hypothetical protein